MDGVICIDKPSEHTSFDVIARMRGILKERKMGHSGTLDPEATGVLPVFIGRATKAIDLIEDHDKEYRATLRLGIETDTQDIWGRVISTRPLPDGLTEQSAVSALMQSVGEQDQLPPMFSAVKVGGVRLYDIAREGREIERTPRRITVYGIDPLGYDDKKGELSFDIRCSKGTYIRTICADVGQRLGIPACMTSLRRTYACGYTEKDCITLEELERAAKENAVDEILKPVETLFKDLPKLELCGDIERLFKNGVRPSLDRIKDCPETDGKIAVFDSQGRFFSVARTDVETGLLVSIKMF